MRERVRPGELLLGVEGVAILRNLLHGDDEQIRARVEELRDFASRLDEQPLSLAFPIPEMDHRTGYAAWSETYDRPGNPLIHLEEPAVHRILDGLEAGTAVDAACGTGRHAAYLLSKGHAVVGVDASPEMLVKARAKIPELRLLQADLRALPMEDSTVDLVVCSLALSHFEKLEPPLAELARVVRPGGHVLLSDIHPAAVLLLGGTAFFQAADGSFAFVRDFPHLHSEYLDTFAKLELEVTECRELASGPKEIEMQVFSYSLAPEATAEAYGGIPFALIWHLVKR